ncbi:MAG: cupin domain-containing protein [Pseudomonadota bacterium]
MSEAVGQRLRKARKARGLSQRELAKRAGVTNSTISLIEQDSVSPSVSSLKKVLDGLPMTMAEFFTTELNSEQASVSFPKADQPNMGQGDIQYFLIGAGRADRQISILREIYGKNSDTGDEMISHTGEEGGVVVSGKLELTVDSEVKILGPGDGYYFDCSLPHRFRNIGDGVLKIVSANCPPTF